MDWKWRGRAGRPPGWLANVCLPACVAWQLWRAAWWAWGTPTDTRGIHLAARTGVKLRSRLIPGGGDWNAHHRKFISIGVVNQKWIFIHLEQQTKLLCNFNYSRYKYPKRKAVYGIRDCYMWYIGRDFLGCIFVRYSIFQLSILKKNVNSITKINIKILNLIK